MLMMDMKNATGTVVVLERRIAKTKSLPSFRTHESDKSIVGVYNIYYVTCYISPESNTC